MSVAVYLPTRRYNTYMYIIICYIVFTFVSVQSPSIYTYNNNMLSTYYYYYYYYYYVCLCVCVCVSTAATAKTWARAGRQRRQWRRLPAPQGFAGKNAAVDVEGVGARGGAGGWMIHRCGKGEVAGITTNQTRVYTALTAAAVSITPLC